MGLRLCARAHGGRAREQIAEGIAGAPEDFEPYTEEGPASAHDPAAQAEAGAQVNGAATVAGDTEAVTLERWHAGEHEKGGQRAFDRAAEGSIHVSEDTEAAAGAREYSHSSELLTYSPAREIGNPVKTLERRAIEGRAT